MKTFGLDLACVAAFLFLSRSCSPSSHPILPHLTPTPCMGFPVADVYGSTSMQEAIVVSLPVELEHIVSEAALQ